MFRRFIFLFFIVFLLSSDAEGADNFSIILLPDTQCYTNRPRFDLYRKQTQWIVDHQAEYNIRFVIHLGDVTGGNRRAEWGVADQAHQILEAAEIPYSILAGNHDLMPAATVFHRNTTNLNTFFNPSRFDTRWYQGSYEGKIENSYYFFDASELKFMVLALEYAPRKDVLTWANRIISEHPDRRVIVSTHLYMTNGGGYTNYTGGKYGIVGCGGSALRDELVSRHSNIFMVVCGHINDSEHKQRPGNAGNRVHEILVDYQSEGPCGTRSPLGNGWLRLLTFLPSQNKIRARTVSVASGDPEIFIGDDRFYGYWNSEGVYRLPYGESPTHADHHFSMAYDLSVMPDYYYLNSSTKFYDRTVNSISSGQQRDPDIGQSADGDFVVAWEDDSDNDGTFSVYVRGFDADGNERFPQTLVHPIGSNARHPALAMRSDGRFVVVFQENDSTIRATTFRTDGSPVNGRIVNIRTGGRRLNPDVAMADNGDFVVVWEDDTGGDGVYQLRARGLHLDTQERFGERTVNSISAGQQRDPAIAMAPGGHFVVVWEDDQEQDGVPNIQARGLAADGSTEVFAQMTVSEGAEGQQINPDVAMDGKGNFVVVWQDDRDDNGSYQIRARGFHAGGAPAMSERTVNSVAKGQQRHPRISMAPAGDFVVVWEDDSFGEGRQMMARGFDRNGVERFSDTRVNSTQSVDVLNGGQRRRPAVSLHPSGRYLVAWEDDMDGNGYYEILAKGQGGWAHSLIVKHKGGVVGAEPAEVFYAHGASVALTAVPDDGYAFHGWAGDVPAGLEQNNPLTLLMNANKSLEAVFVPTSAPPVAFWRVY